MFKAKIADNKKEEGGTGTSMLHGAIETMYPDDSSTPAEHRSTEEATDLLNQGMDYLEFEDQTARINFCFKTIGLQECT